MNPSLLSAALLCTATCAASAQTSVSIYGIADAWVGQIHHKVGAPATGRMSVLESGGAQASRWGLRGSEDLGGGLSARFVLEQGISIDSGTVTNVSASNVGFNRNAYVALARSGIGEVRLGRMLTAYDALRGSNNQLYDSSGFASTGQVWSAGAAAGGSQAAVTGSDYLARGNNTVLLRTAPLGPFIASVSVSAGEGASTETASPRLVTGHVEYGSGAVRVGYAFQDERYTNGTNKFDMIAAAYQFAGARVVANYQHQSDERVAAGQKSREYQIGVNAPFGAATLALGYARAVTRNGAGRELVDASGMSAMATYDLSKRTRLYTAFRKLSVDRGDGTRAFEQTRYGVGMTHLF
jgi:predicted porin